MIRDEQEMRAIRPCISDRESADYTYDMLRQLEQMAKIHNQLVLARLLDLAAREAALLRRLAQGEPAFQGSMESH